MVEHFCLLSNSLRLTLNASLDITGYQMPPGMVNTDEMTSYKVLFTTWCRWFHGYSIEEIGMCNRFWNRIEKWLKHNALHIYETLRPPPSLQLIEEVENKLNYKIPRLVKLLYRFHDGQNIHADRIRLGQVLPYKQITLENGTKVRYFINLLIFVLYHSSADSHRYTRTIMVEC